MADIKAIKGTNGTTYSIVDRFSEWGGYNLLRLTGENINYDDYTNSLRGWAQANTYGSISHTGNVFTHVLNGTQTNLTTGFRFVSIASDGNVANSSPTLSLNYGIDMKIGDVYTYSVDAQTTGTYIRFCAQFYNGSSVWNECPLIDHPNYTLSSTKAIWTVSDTNWHRYFFTFTIPSNFISFTAIPNGVDTTTGGTITTSFKNMKLEKGHKATDWSPSWNNLFTYSNNIIMMNI